MSKFSNIVLVPFPFTNLSGQKIRPAIQLTSFAKDDVVICAISTKKHSSYDIKIVPTRDNGLKQVSYIRTNKLATIEKRLVLAKLGELDVKTYKSIKQKIKLLLKL